MKSKTAILSGAEPLAVQAFALQGGEERLAHGVIKAVAHRARRWPYAPLAAALPEGNGSVLRALDIS